MTEHEKNQLEITGGSFKDWYFNESFFKDWIDPVGLIHVQPNPPDTAGSENGILFTAILWALAFKSKGKKGMERSARFWDEIVSAHVMDPSFSNDYDKKYDAVSFKQTPWGNVDPSSHDNDTGIRGISYINKDFKSIDWHVSGRVIGKFWHPRDIIFYWWLAGGLRRLFVQVTGLMLLMILIQAWSCIFPYAERNGNKIVDTSGKNLCWLRCAVAHDSWVMQFSLWVNTRILATHYHIFDYGADKYVDISSHTKCFDYYFRHPDYPTVGFARTVVGE